jgi:hypothetical protein
LLHVLALEHAGDGKLKRSAGSDDRPLYTAELARASCVSISTPQIKKVCLLLFEPTSQARFIPML